MKSQSYARSNEDSCLYTKKCIHVSYVILILYVDDMLIAGKNKDELSKLKENLSQTFDTKNLGNAKHILRMCITRDMSNGCIYLSQSEYVCKILKSVNMESGKPWSTPLSMHVKLSKYECPKSDNEKEFMSKIPYQSVVGSLMYTMITTRLDIAFVVGVVSRFLSNYGKKHWETVKMILRYLCGTKNKCLCLGGGNYYLLLDIQIQIMLVVPRVENLLRAIFFSLWEMPYLGDLVSKSVLLCPVEKLSMLQSAKHARKPYGYPN